MDVGTVAEVMKYFQPKSRIAGVVTKLKAKTNHHTLKSAVKALMMLKIVASSVSYIMDLAKDSIILVEISRTQGGFYFMMNQPTNVKTIFFCFLGSILVPFILSSITFLRKGPKVIFGHNGTAEWTAMILLIPIYPVFLNLRDSLLTYASKSYKISVQLLEDVKFNAAQFIQADIGMESHLQIILSIVLLLQANSETRTIIGLEVLFKDESFLWMSAKSFFVLSTIKSCFSCVTSHIKGINKKREHSTTMSYLTLLIFTSASISLRILSFILYLTPGIGLFNILRHLQGEMYPYHQPFYEKVINLNESFFFGNAPPIPWSKITRWKYVGYTIAEPPEATLYTYYTIDTYFNVLVIAFAVNIYLQWAMKKVTNPEVFRSLSFIESMIHAISCCFIPYPMKEWDEQKGNVSMHQQRKKKVWREMMASIMLNFTINILLLSPLIVLGTLFRTHTCNFIFHFSIIGYNIFERHDIIVNSIGAFPQEIQAYEKIQLLIGLGYSSVVFLTIIQVVSYYFYNGKFHPFAMIVMPEQNFESPKEITLISVKKRTIT